MSAEDWRELNFISLSVSVTDDLKSLVLSLQARVDKLDGGEREREG